MSAEIEMGMCPNCTGYGCSACKWTGETPCDDAVDDYDQRQDFDDGDEIVYWRRGIDYSAAGGPRRY